MQGIQTGKIVLDIGGTLAKLCYVTNSTLTTIPHNQKLAIKLSEQSLFFVYFKNIEECWSYIDSNFNLMNDEKIKNPICQIIATGGGAYKYQAQLKELASKKNNISIVIVQQFESLVGGLNFFKKYSSYQEFVCSVITNNDSKQIQLQKIAYSQMKCPMLVVNVGSGVSILKIIEKSNGQLSAERVGGTSLGGGFFMGLANLLTGQNDFQKLLQMAEKGNVKNTDIIPSDFPELSEQFSEASVLVSLGKLDENSSKQDIVKSLFYMVTFNIAQISLSYSEILEIDNVLFTGFYCRQNQFVLKCFAEAFNFFTKKTNIKHVYSMQHDGFLGTLGALHLQYKKNNNQQ